MPGIRCCPGSAALNAKLLSLPVDYTNGLSGNELCMLGRTKPPEVQHFSLAWQSVLPLVLCLYLVSCTICMQITFRQDC